MVAPLKLLTNEEFWAFAQLPENREKRLELVDGVIIEMAPSSNKNTIVVARFIAHLVIFVEAHDLGYVAAPDGGFDMGPGNVRQADAAFISKDRSPDVNAKMFVGAPDLAIEVVSPNGSSREVIDKARLYLTHGGRMVWAAYPESKVVDAYKMNEHGQLVVETIDINGELDGGDVLPGFKLPLKKIFLD